MRLTPLRLALLFGAALCLLGPTTGFTQPGGGGGKKGGGGGPGGGGGFNFDPAAIAQRSFGQYSKDGKVINIADMPTQGKGGQNPQEALQAWAQSHGVTNGQITLEQYTQYMQDRMSQFQQGGGMGKGNRGAPPGQGTGGPGGPSNFQQPQPPRDFDKDAADSFSRHDKEGNGRLTIDDVPRWLQDEWEMWDKGGKGFLDLSDYKDAYKAHQNTIRGLQDGNGATQDPRNRGNRDNQEVDPGQEGDKRQTVYHAGNMPKDLPAWFVQLDRDKDGQVALYEWKKGNVGNLDLFAEMDANGDGFLTPEEVLRWQKAQIAKRKAKANGGGGEDDDEGDGTPSDQPKTQPGPSFPGQGRGGNFPGRGGNGFQPGGGGNGFQQPGGGNGAQRPGRGGPSGQDNNQGGNGFQRPGRGGPGGQGNNPGGTDPGNGSGRTGRRGQPGQ